MRGFVIAVLSLLIVTSDTSRFLPLLQHNLATVLSKGEFSFNEAPLLWQAAVLGDEDSRVRLVGLVQENPDNTLSAYWLDKLVEHDSPEAAWVLYQQHVDEVDASRYLRIAARGGVAPAQLVYAMVQESGLEREKWLFKSANQGHVPAQTALADWYLLHNEHNKALPWLQKTAQADAQSAFKLGRLLWRQGDKENAIAWFNKAKEKGNHDAERFVYVLERYTPKPPAEFASFSWPETKTCHQRIQFIGVSLATVSRADYLYNEYVNDTRLTGLSLCIAPPIWLSSDDIACSPNYNGQPRLGCDVTAIASIVEARELTHAIIVAQQGKANVNNGVMFLDMSDAYSVFVHELAHFSGFIDEYPLSRMSARRYCETDFTADSLPIYPPNLVFDGQLTYHPVATVEQWLNLDPHVEIAHSKTCEHIGVYSYKPTRDITFMEHHDSGVIPPLYLALWEQQLAKPAIQRPISMNLFQSYHAKGAQSKAGHWLRRYQADVESVGSTI